MRNDFCTDYLAHSSGWTKKVHKYIERIWKKGKWYYRYPLTGKGYMEEMNKKNFAAAAAKFNLDQVEKSKKAHKSPVYSDWYQKQIDYNNRQNVFSGGNRDYYSNLRDAKIAEKNYYTKSLKGRAEKSIDNAIKKGEKAISKLLKKNIATPVKTKREDLSPPVTKKTSGAKKENIPSEPYVPKVEKVGEKYRVGAKHFFSKKEAEEYQQEHWGKAHDEWEKKYGSGKKK